MRTLLLASLLICAALAGCTKRRVITAAPPANTLVEGTVIKGPGHWTHTDGRRTHALTITHSGKDVEWFYEYPNPGGSGGGGASMTAATPFPWFFYVESPLRIWIFDGAGGLSCQTNSSAGSIETEDAISDGKLQDDSGKVPPEVVPLLPAELQKLFPAKASKPRPSI